MAGTNVEVSVEQLSDAELERARKEAGLEPEEGDGE